MDKHSSSLRKSVNYEQKSLITIGSGVNLKKTFLLRHLPRDKLECLPIFSGACTGKNITDLKSKDSAVSQCVCSS
jgi:hypothetical protein